MFLTSTLIYLFNYGLSFSFNNGKILAVLWRNNLTYSIIIIYSILLNYVLNLLVFLKLVFIYSFWDYSLVLTGAV